MLSNLMFNSHTCGCLDKRKSEFWSQLLSFPEKKPDQSEALTLETEQTAAQSPAMKVNSGEYVAHEVKLVPNVNLDPATTPASSAGIQEGMVQGNIPSAVSSQRTSSNGIQQPARNYGVVPSFLIVPKRRVLHNVRSNLKTNVPGRLTLSGNKYRMLTGYFQGLFRLP